MHAPFTPTASAKRAATATPAAGANPAAQSASTRKGTFLVRILVITFCAILISLAAAYASTSHATSAYAEENTVNVVRTSNTIQYGNYQTTELRADGNIAYCAQPLKRLPADGSYSTQIASGNLAAAMWYAYGAPGFDASMWPSTNYLGEPMTAGDYFVASHVVLAYFYTGSPWEATYAGDGESGMAFTSWAKENLLGIDAEGKPSLACPASAIAANAGNVGSGFTALIILSGSDTSQTLMSYSYTGSLQITKTVDTQGLSSSLYGSAEATFGIYADEACTSLIATATTDQSGVAQVDGLPLGTVYVKETQPPTNTVINTTVYPVTITGGVATLDVVNSPKLGSLDILVYKQDAQSQQGTPQGDATLEGAVFTVSYFDNLQGDTSGTPTATWQFSTNKDGVISFSNTDELMGLLISGTLIKDASGQACLPIGTCLIQETSAPEGYLLDSTSHVLVISPEASSEKVTVALISQTSNKDGIPVSNDQVIRGGVQVFKELEGAQISTPNQGLTGTTFQICNQSEEAVLVDGTWYEPDSPIMEISAAWNEDMTGFTAQTSADALPYGTYSIQEVSAPEGIQLTDTQIRYFQIREDGEMVTMDVEENPLVFVNKIAETPTPDNPDNPDNPDGPGFSDGDNPDNTDGPGGDNGGGNGGNNGSNHGAGEAPKPTIPETADALTGMTLALLASCLITAGTVLAFAFAARRRNAQ